MAQNYRFDERKFSMITKDDVVRASREVGIEQGDRVGAHSSVRDLCPGLRRPDDVRAVARAARGVRGIRLKRGDRVVDMALVTDGASLLTVCEHGYGKRTPFEEYSTRRRGGQGVINILTTRRNGKVVAAREVRQDEEIMVTTQAGMMVRIPADSIRSIARRTQGVRLIRLGKGDCVTGLAKVMPEEVEEHADGGA